MLVTKLSTLRVDIGICCTEIVWVQQALILWTQLTNQHLPGRCRVCCEPKWKEVSDWFCTWFLHTVPPVLICCLESWQFVLVRTTLGIH